MIVRSSVIDRALRRPLPDLLTSELHNYLLSVTAHYLLLDHGSGTVCMETSSLPHR